ncbi:MAG: DUF4358 domain-containing protein [Clostridia bacterium]|nr:DUF4358 domain-containing protein [Clostridia bacterium]
MKKALTLCLTLTLLALSACAPKYTTDIPIYDVADRAIASIDPNVHYVRADRGYLDGYFPLSEEASAQEIYYATDGNNLDEFGIFYTDDPDDLADDLRDYLDDCLEENRTFYDSYIPEETPKLRDAEVRTFGNCVAYAILSPSHKKAFFDTLDETLRV